MTRQPRRRSWWNKVFVGRFMLGHLIAYPVGFVAAVAAMPLAMMVRKQELLDVGNVGAENHVVRKAVEKLGLTAMEAGQVEIVLGFCLWASLLPMLLVHLLALPWAAASGISSEEVVGLDPRVKRTWRLFLAGTLGSFVVIVLVGVVSWLWVLLQ